MKSGEGGLKGHTAPVWHYAPPIFQEGSETGQRYILQIRWRFNQLVFEVFDTVFCGQFAESERRQTDCPLSP